MGGKKTAFEHSAGGVVTRRKDGFWEFLVIKDRFGRWSFPKGHLEEGERAEETARREVEEETGVRGAVLAYLGRVRYFFTREGRRIGKTVEWYLMREEGGTPRPQKGEIEEVGWIRAEELDSLPTYPQMRDLLHRALEVLEQPGTGHGGSPRSKLGARRSGRQSRAGPGREGGKRPHEGS